MFYVYSKEKQPKLIFTINLTEQEVTDYVGWDNIYEGYPGTNKTNSIIVERDNPFNYPILDNDSIREMTREEKVDAGIEVQLEAGEVIRDKKIIKIEKPSKNERYLVWDKEQEQWDYDSEREKTDYFNLIDSLKAQTLEYGFDYQIGTGHHRQRCRDKDIAEMTATVMSLQIAKEFGLNKKAKWYFEDNFAYEVGLKELGTLMLYGTSFIQSIYDTENYFKTEVSPKELSKEEFEAKRKEIHSQLVGM